MKKFIVLIFIFLFPFCLFGRFRDNGTDQIIIKFKKDEGESKVFAKIKNASLKINKKAELKRKFGEDKYIIKLDGKKNEEEISSIIEELKKELDIELAEPDRIAYPALVPNDPYYSWQWHYKSSSTEIGGVNLPSAWDITMGSSSVVAVLDTGVLPHEDISSSKILPGADLISDSFIANDGNGRDNNPYDNGDWCSATERNTPGNLCYDSSCAPSCTQENSSWHGLHVSGTIGADTNNSKGLSGISPNSKILPVRVLGKGGGYSSDIADAIKWAIGVSVSGVSNNANPAKIINMSLGGSGACPSDIQTAINQAIAQDVAVVVAAGNDSANLNANSYWPSNCLGVISVAATTREGHKAWYSNYGSSVFISAPGGENSDPVYSTLNSGTTNPTTDTYAGYIGTSMAAPHVSGVIALMLGIKPSLTLNEIRYNLQKTARGFPPGSTCNTSICGFGIIDAYSALNNLLISISSASQNTAMNNQNLPISVYGKGFLSQAQVKLKRNGYSDIDCQSVNVINLNRIDCVMPLTGVSTGTWNIFAYNLDGSSYTLANYFSITSQSLDNANPNYGYNNKALTVNFYGSGFIWPFSVKLSKTGNDDINCYNYGYNDSTNVYCDFNLSGAFVGKRDIVFTNGDGKIFTITDGFQIINSSTYINSITPSSGYNDRSVEIKIYGGGFLSTSTAKLVKTGFSDLQCSLFIYSSTYSVCSLDLNGEWEGLRDFVLYSGTNTVIKTDYFNIISQNLSVSTVNPVAGYNNDSNCLIKIYGTGFKQISEPKLTKSSYPDISPYSFEIKSSTFIIGYFDLTNKVYGKRDVRVYNGSNFAFKTEGFNIIDALGSPYIYAIYPKSDFNNSNPLINIYGDNFINGLIIKLTREGFDDIVVNDFNIVSSTHISNVILPLAGRTPGLWNIRVINPNSYYADYDGFSLLEVKENTKVYNPVINSKNNEVIINYNSSKDYKVNVKVYDNMGNLIRILYSGSASVGLNQLKWDGKDSNARKVKNGIYIIRIETPDYTEHRRVVVVK